MKERWDAEEGKGKQNEGKVREARGMVFREHGAEAGDPFPGEAHSPPHHGPVLPRGCPPPPAHLLT